jgi:hypothetical protein
MLSQTGDGSMRPVLASALCAGLLAGCAQAPQNVEMAYTSPLLYEHYTCGELALHATRISAVVAQLSGHQSHRATRDAVHMGVGLVVFWPSLFFIEGNSALTGELARLKGEAFAVQQAAINKNCGFEYRPY